VQCFMKVRSAILGYFFADRLAYRANLKEGNAQNLYLDFGVDVNRGNQNTSTTK
jgi:hypothetical protein